ncbi:MAG: hypothetical protein EBT92_16540 [Planctomycetes bacterium]|nr:hypothetical protein [Planctomycetota bacterium]NBY00869.1 hypothetical protein [Planctomycetota bacterium]
MLLRLCMEKNGLSSFVLIGKKVSASNNPGWFTGAFIPLRFKADNSVPRWNYKKLGLIFLFYLAVEFWG